MFNIAYAAYAVWEFYKVQVIIFVLLCKVVQTVYLYLTGYVKWYLGMIPLAHLYYKRDAGAVPLYLLIPYGLLIAWVTFFPFPFYVVLLLLLAIACNYKFAVLYVDQHSSVVYSVVPFGKYVIMIKDIISIIRSTNKEEV